MANDRLKYFNLLGIHPTDNVDAIKKAYRKMAFKFHPDRNTSPDAHVRFIQITEAYEVLTGQRKPQAESKPRQKTEEELFAEKVAFAKARYKQQQEEEARKDAAYYTRITSGWRWRWFKIGAVYCLIVSCLLSADFFLTSTTEAIPFNRATIIPAYRTISTGREHFLIENTTYWNNEHFGQIRGNRSFFFQDLKSVSVVLNPPDPLIEKPSDRLRALDDFNDYDLYTAYSFRSVYELFPFLHLALILPILLVKFRRPVLQFSVWRLISIYVLIPTALALLISNDRLFHLLRIF